MFLELQVASAVFRELKKTADEELETTTTHAIVGVPSFFSALQRNALISAGTFQMQLEIQNKPFSNKDVFLHLTFQVNRLA